MFGAYGVVEDLDILRDQGGRSSGAAFVTYASTLEADTAIFTLHNRFFMIPKKPIQVSYAKSSPNISVFGTFKAVEVHKINPTNPLPEAAGARNVERTF